MYCPTNQFTKFQVLRPHNKTHGLRGLGNYYHMRFDPKLGHVTCAIRCIPCDFTLCTPFLDQPYIPGMTSWQQPSYPYVKDCTYWHVLGYFNNWDILKLSNKATSSEELEKNIKFYSKESVRTRMCWYKPGNMVPLIQQIKLQWDNM